jgi:hypothetical protein
MHLQKERQFIKEVLNDECSNVGFDHPKTGGKIEKFPILTTSSVE